MIKKNSNNNAYIAIENFQLLSSAIKNNSFEHEEGWRTPKISYYRVEYLRSFVSTVGPFFSTRRKWVGKLRINFEEGEPWRFFNGVHIHIYNCDKDCRTWMREQYVTWIWALYIFYQGLTWRDTLCDRWQNTFVIHDRGAT